MREGGAITERLVASPPADPEVRWFALLAHSQYLSELGRRDAARPFADEAYRTAPDAKTRSCALIRRGLINLFAGHPAEAVKDHAEATALARGLHDDRAFLAAALVGEAQALISARSFDEAAARLDEARTVGSPVDANALGYLNTCSGDLAILGGRPADALEPFARSLEQAFADGLFMQIAWDLLGVAEALAALGHDAEALEAAGMAESQGAELGVTMTTFFFDYEHLATLEQRIGLHRATKLKERGRAADPADRVARACQLARSHTAPSVVARE